MKRPREWDPAEPALTWAQVAAVWSARNPDAPLNEHAVRHYGAAALKKLRSVAALRVAANEYDLERIKR